MITTLWRERRADILLVLLAIALTAFTLSYPLGPDQGGFHYVGRQWVTHGRLPYRDAVEHKPPGIYIYYALTILLLGDNMDGIRVVDLALTLLLGVLATRLSCKEKVAPGMYGVGALFTAIAHHGFFIFWDTAQCDFVAMLFLFLSVYHLMRDREGRAWRAGMAGLFVGLSILMKPYAIALLFPGVLFLHRLYRIRRTRRVLLRDLGLFAAAAVMPSALAVGYFAARGALPDLVEWVFRVNKFYWQHERGVDSVRGALDATRLNYVTLYGGFIYSLAVAAACGSVIAVRARDRERMRAYGTGWLFTVLGYSAVAIQLKFFRYHFAAMLPGMACLAMSVFDHARAWATSRWPDATRRAFPGVAALSILGIYSGTDQATHLWLQHYPRTVSFWRGRITPAEYYRPFDVPGMIYSYADSYEVGEYIRARSEPDEEILVRGFCTQIYYAADRYYSGRFYWSNFVTEPSRMMRPEAWKQEDLEHWQRTRPRFIVTLWWPGPVTGPEDYERAGYVKRETFGLYTVLERPRQ